ncbi:MAG: 3,4-dihydroxy-2-butanone 4-phosphate synthase [marine bacterium B5-7]|nr:MAG: 3,4-dihydroxy-2-butanone 4-phosphate synthase [marine bacterium B5-7]
MSSTSINSPISSIEEIIEDYRNGKMVILVDDEDRENEGDLVIAAEATRAEHINFMASHGRGLICLTLTEERCRRLGLTLMVQDNNARYLTNFTVSIEAAVGVTTGISAADRAVTVAAAVGRDAQPSDIVTPGHIFPIMAQPGGVLNRAGHTEAGVDLARICGFEPASVICEILNPDGSMARLADLITYGQTHGIKIGTIADLIRWRLTHEPTVTRVSSHDVTTSRGQFRAYVYEDSVANSTHLALATGDIVRDEPTLVRVHVHSGVFDTMMNTIEDGDNDAGRALNAIMENGSGILVLLDYPTNGSYVSRKIADLKSNSSGDAEIDAVSDLRMVGAGSQILGDLNAGKVRVLGTPRRTHALSGFNIEIVDYVVDY